MRRRSANLGAALLLVAGLMAAVLCPGCGPKADRGAWLDYAERLSPQVGQAKFDEFVREWGMPHRRVDLDDGYACNWHFSKGTRSAGIGYIVSFGRSYQAYDDVLLIFDDNHVLKEWKVECTR